MLTYIVVVLSRESTLFRDIIKKCLDINKNTLLQNELEFLSFEYVLEYCQSKFIWWALKSDNRKKVFMSWFNYLGNKKFKDKPVS